MADYFTARGLPGPKELQRNVLTEWRRTLVVAIAIAVFYVSFKVTDIDTSRANLPYAMNVVGQLLHFDFLPPNDVSKSVLFPQNEFETFWDGAIGLMIVTIFLGILGTAF